MTLSSELVNKENDKTISLPSLNKVRVNYIGRVFKNLNRAGKFTFLTLLFLSKVIKAQAQNITRNKTDEILKEIKSLKQTTDSINVKLNWMYFAAAIIVISLGIFIFRFVRVEEQVGKFISKNPREKKEVKSNEMV